MSCYPTIGLRDVCETPDAVYYINDLPEFTFKALAKIANEEQVNASTLFTDTYNAAVKFVKADLIQKFPTFKSILYSDEYGTESTTYLATDSGERGIRIEAYDCCKYVRPYIKTIRFLTNTTISDKAFFIYEDNLSSTPTEYSVDLVAGQYSEVNVQFNTESRVLYIMWDTDDIAVNDGGLGADGTGCCNSCDPCQCNPYLSVQDHEETSVSNYGIFPTLDAICHEDVMACDVAKYMERLILYRMAGMIAEQALYNSSWSNYLIYNKDRFHDIVVKYMGGIHQRTGDVHKGEYYKEFETVLLRVNDYLRAEGQCCFKCGVGSFQYVRP